MSQPQDLPSGDDAAAEWESTQIILAWGRRDGRLQAVVQEYRFGRRQGDSSEQAYGCAARRVASLDASIADPLIYAGVLVQWMEREHRDWFWRCCRDHHVL
jgi:hypothetical protein